MASSAAEKRLDPAAQADEGEMHAVAQHDEDDADQKRPDP